MCVYKDGSTHIRRYTCMLGMQVHTPEDTDAWYIYGYVHIYVRYTCLCIKVNMSVETHLLFFFFMQEVSLAWNTKASLTGQCYQSSEVSISPVLGQSKFSLHCKIFKRIKLNNLIKF